MQLHDSDFLGAVESLVSVLVLLHLLQLLLIDPAQGVDIFHQEFSFSEESVIACSG